MILKKHHSKDKLVLALCDSELLDKKIEQGDLILDLKSEFYHGNKTTETEILKEIGGAYLINAVGKKAVEILLKNNIISKKLIKHVASVPYVQILLED